MRRLDLLSPAEEAQVQAAGQLPDRVDMFTTILTSKDPRGSDALQAFVENSDSQVSQLIIMHGKVTWNGMVFVNQ